MPNGGPAAQPREFPKGARKRPAAAQPDDQPDGKPDGKPDAKPDAKPEARSSVELKRWSTSYTERFGGELWRGTLCGLAWDQHIGEVQEHWKWNKDTRKDKGTDTGKDKDADTGKDKGADTKDKGKDTGKAKGADTGGSGGRTRARTR